MPLTIMDKTTRRKINKEIEDWNTIIDQLDLTDIYRTLHSTTVEHKFFSSALETFSKLEYILVHKVNFNEF